MNRSENPAWNILREFCLSEHVSTVDNVRAVCDKMRYLYPLFCDTRLSFTNTTSSGVGVVACSAISRGELVLIDHPVVRILDVELGASQYSNLDGGDSLALLDVLSVKYNREIEMCLLELYPVRDSKYTDVSENGNVPLDVYQRLASELPHSMSVNSVFRAVQLNSLGFYTFPELCTYNEHLRFLSGTGIYRTASMFNHSCAPNVDHYSFGDVAFFRALRDVAPGEELFITYIGRDLLGEAKSIRDDFLGTRDFVCRCSKCLEPENEDPWMDELDLQTRISIHMAPTNEARVCLLRTLLLNTTYLSRDRLELSFSLCRALGYTRPEEWKSLIKSLDSTDFLYIVILVHFMVNCGYDESIADSIRHNSVNIRSDYAVELVGFTDFTASSELRSNFLDVYNRFIDKKK